MPLALSSLHPGFLFAMVQALYAEEARQILSSELMNYGEMNDFYLAYLGYPA